MADLKSLTREVEAEAVGIVRFCADEVERQRAEPEAVCWMVEAWLMARRRFEKTPPLQLATSLTLKMITEWGQRVEPVKNRTGFREFELRGGQRVWPPSHDIPGLMERFVAAIRGDEGWPLCPPVGHGVAEHAYYIFQMIHPFADGNGRVGKVIYCWLRGCLNNPEMPPNFFNCANP